MSSQTLKQAIPTLAQLLSHWLAGVLEAARPPVTTTKSGRRRERIPLAGNLSNQGARRPREIAPLFRPLHSVRSITGLHTRQMPSREPGFRSSLNHTI